MNLLNKTAHFVNLRCISTPPFQVEVASIPAHAIPKIRFLRELCGNNKTTGGGVLAVNADWLRLLKSVAAQA